MINNDVLRSVRFMLKVDDATLASIVRAGKGEATSSDIIAFLKRDDEAGYRLCENHVMSSFLDGLIVHLRGPPKTATPRPPETNLTNNTVLKKLRVAFGLKEDDLLALMAHVGFEVSRPELSALFRAPEHHNFRPCGDQFLRNFLKGLTARVRR